MPFRILVADDQSDIRESLRLLLKAEGFQVELADSPSQVLACLEQRRPDVLLMDMNFSKDTTSGQEGLELLENVRTKDPSLPVVVLTAWGSVELAVAAMQRGAKDFVQKPWENARLLSTISTQLELAEALRKSRKLEAENELLRGDTQPIIARSNAMKSILELVHRMGKSEANVLITGENGTGKSLLAKYIHQKSQRGESPFITLNAGGLSEGVLESELFGHVKGAYTDAKKERCGRFELADGGTLFLDEIGNAPLSLQAKLLRVLETGEFERVGSSQTQKVNVRILSATNAYLDQEISAGRFRQDLRFRLNTLEIHVPALRERPEDIRPLAECFLNRHNHKYRKGLIGFEAQALTRLERHTWPGNVRELDHVIERAVILEGGASVSPESLMISSVGHKASGLQRETNEMSLEDMEAQLIEKALAKSRNAAEAAQALGLSRSAMYRRMQKLGIKTPL